MCQVERKQRVLAGSAVGVERNVLNLWDGARSAVTSSPAVGRVEIPVVDLLWQESGNRLLPSAARPAVPAQRVRGGLGSAGVAARHEKWGRVAQWGPASASCHPTSLQPLSTTTGSQSGKEWLEINQWSCKSNLRTCSEKVDKKVRHQFFFVLFLYSYSSWYLFYKSNQPP